MNASIVLGLCGPECSFHPPLLHSSAHASSSSSVSANHCLSLYRMHARTHTHLVPSRSLCLCYPPHPLPSPPPPSLISPIKTCWSRLVHSSAATLVYIPATKRPVLIYTQVAGPSVRPRICFNSSRNSFYPYKNTSLAHPLGAISLLIKSSNGRIELIYS